ncbi:hypothetical protein BDY21DRAFT_362885 [Lineolata rhizophorae]|uniref:Uncharacterized protein n=1 Tax=Lineolata rhizophorae TaxID=578093 RepID=A0A6A6P3R0_9PEZI|nr:hypothetical protein BDY21DRAFT_362885 [Lineolata rhizophorae]
MSQEYANQDLNVLAKQAEQDLNSHDAKTGHDKTRTARGAGDSSDSTVESGVDESVRYKFPGADVRYGSSASGAGDNRRIPPEEGGEYSHSSGLPATKAADFEGPGGPETKEKLLEEQNPGSDEVRGNIRQGGDTIRPAGSMSTNISEFHRDRREAINSREDTKQERNPPTVEHLI